MVRMVYTIASKAQGLMEYTLLLGLIAVVVIAGLQIFGGAVASGFPVQMFSSAMYHTP